MQKNILALTLCCSVFTAIPSPGKASNTIELFVEQCLTTPYVDLNDPLFGEFEVEQADMLAISFERQTLGLQNLNSLLQYYRKQPLSTDDRKSLLQCQIKLADQLGQMLDNRNFDKFSLALERSPDNELRQLAKNLSRLKQEQLGVQQKSQLHLAQASIAQTLKKQSIHLEIPDPKCQLKPKGSTPVNGDTGQKSKPQLTTPSSFKRTIASYLIEQPNLECRKLAWQSYQGRASNQNYFALQRLYELRQQQAINAKASDYSHLQLQRQLLSSPEQVQLFLASQTENIQVAPWNIGRQLAQQPKEQFVTIESSVLIQSIADRFPALSVTFETVNANRLRLWHEKRYLGELILDYSEAPSQFVIMKHPVVGQQFGLGQLSLQTKVGSARELRHFAQALAEAIVSLSKGSRYYFNNTLGATQDIHQLPVLWLSQYLIQQLRPLEQAAPRTLLRQKYVKQLKVFRAKEALNRYLTPENKIYSDMRLEFKASFGADWQQTNDYQYSFKGIALHGPLYYQSLWQDYLVQLINQGHGSPAKQATVFNLLIMNPNNQGVVSQLETLLGSVPFQLDR